VKPMPLRHSGRRVAYLAGRQKISDFRPGQPLRRIAQRIRDGLKLTLCEDLRHGLSDVALDYPNCSDRIFGASTIKF
jgi:hypothetical protein